MIPEMLRFEELLTKYFELDDLQATEIVIATAVSHKVGWSEMLWLRIIGASGTGKTELLRTLIAQKPYCTEVENITAGAIRRGYVVNKKEVVEATLLQRLNGTLAITKEFASMLTKDTDAQKEIFGLLRSVYDGALTADYGSEQGHLSQKTHFDWILGSTSYIDKIRSVEYLLGSRFIDIHWDTPQQREKALNKAINNNLSLDAIREALSRALADVMTFTLSPEVPKLDYIAQLADIAACLRSPVVRDNYTHLIEDLPEIELGTRMAQGLSRIATGLKMIGVADADLKPYLTRVVFNSMTRIRASVIKAWINGMTKQIDIADSLGVNQSAVSRIVEDIKMLHWKDEWLKVLDGYRSKQLTF